MAQADFEVPKALTILAGVFLISGGIFAIFPIVDTVVRRGWKSMMWIMIPVWPINACYLGPLTLFLYFRYGRPAPRKRPDERDEAMAMKDHDDQEAERGQGLSRDHSDARLAEGEESRRRRQQSADGNRHGDSDGEEERQDMEGMHDMHDMSGGRPMLATVLIGVSHCGAGCVLGDLVGEWIVYGTGAKINGHPIWAELLIDYGFALLFGILFQYFSIAPMSGQYGPKTIVRAVKADILSLTSFELGLFGWMVIYQVAIWDYNLKITTYTYWWMMQVGMILGYATAVPVNWWLIKSNIKEPCA